MIEPFTGDLDAVAAYTGGAPVRALLVATDAFFPRIRSGEYVVVADEGTVSNGDDVLVHLRDGKGGVMLYQYLYESDGAYVFQHFKERMQVTVSRDFVALMEPIFGVYNKRAKVSAIKSDAAG